MTWYYIKSSSKKILSIIFILALFIFIIHHNFSKAKTFNAWLISIFITLAGFIIYYLMCLIDKKMKTGIFYLALSVPIITYVYIVLINIYLSQKQGFSGMLAGWTGALFASLILSQKEERDKISLKNKITLSAYYTFIWVITIIFSW